MRRKVPNSRNRTISGTADRIGLGYDGIAPHIVALQRLRKSESEEKREEIRRYFHDTFDVEEKLFEVMAKDEAYFQT